MIMTTVAKGELKARLLAYLREVERTGEDIIVTDHRVPVLKITALRPRQSPAAVFADLRTKAQLKDAAVLATTEKEWTDV